MRDLLLGRENRDLDLVVEGDGPRFARRLAAELGGRVREHEAFMTAVVVDAEGFHIDVATARSEFYREPAALPEVASSALRQDLYRRDFTINTLAVRLGPGETPELIDHFGARRDLEEGTIRVLHSLSFIDDPTRVLRAVRLEQRLGFEIAPETLHLIQVALEEGVFERLSGSRLREELILLLDDPAVALRGLDRLAELGLLAPLDPGLEMTAAVRARLRAAVGAHHWYRLADLDGPAVALWRLLLIALTADLDAAAVERLAGRLMLAGERPPRHRRGRGAHRRRPPAPGASPPAGPPHRRGAGRSARRGPPAAPGRRGGAGAWPGAPLPDRAAPVPAAGARRRPGGGGGGPRAGGRRGAQAHPAGPPRRRDRSGRGARVRPPRRGGGGGAVRRARLAAGLLAAAALAPRLQAVPAEPTARAADPREVVLVDRDCTSSSEHQRLTVFANGVVRVRLGPPGDERMVLDSLAPDDLAGLVRALAAIDLGEAADAGSAGPEGAGVEHCRLDLPLLVVGSPAARLARVPPAPSDRVETAGPPPSRFEYGRFDSLSLPLARVVALVDDLVARTLATAPAGSLPRDYRPRPGDVLRRVDGALFRVVRDTADTPDLPRGWELQGVEQPLVIYIAEGSIGREFVELVSRRDDLAGRRGPPLMSRDARHRPRRGGSASRAASCAAGSSGCRGRRPTAAGCARRCSGSGGRCSTARVPTCSPAAEWWGSRRRAAAPERRLRGEGTAQRHLLEQNVRRTGTTGAVAVRCGALPGALETLAEDGPFDLVFADPPYRFPDYAALLAAVAGLLAAGGEAVIEHSARRELPAEAAGLVRVDVRRYGESALSFYRRGPE